MLESRDQGYQGEAFKWLHEGQAIEIMQFTGLHDIVGEGIYEGDILGDEEGTCSVCWDESNGRWAISTPSDGISDSLEAWHDVMEIVGNIYENPELLTFNAGRAEGE